MSDTPMPLDFAVRRFFPHGGVTKEQMLAAIRRGQLRAEKIGRAYLVTAGDIREWRRTCRVNGCQPGSISGSAKVEMRVGSLSMDERKLTLAAALASIKALKKSSAPTSRKRGRSTPPAGTPLKLVSRT